MIRVVGGGDYEALSAAAADAIAATVARRPDALLLLATALARFDVAVRKPA